MLTPQPFSLLAYFGSNTRSQAFAGIGRPEKFRDTLAAAGAVVEGWSSFPDHYVYEQEDLKELVEVAEARGCPVLTTSKDYVRLPSALKPRVAAFAVTLEWQDAKAVADCVTARLEGGSV